MAEYSKEKIGFQLARALSHPFVSICYTKFPRHDSMDSKPQHDHRFPPTCKIVEPDSVRP